MNLSDMHDFSPYALIEVFKWLDIRDLNRCCQVCVEWRDLICGSSLWKHIDLTEYRWRLDNNSLSKLITSRFAPCLRSLNLSGFSITPCILNKLFNECFNLKAVMLERARFIGFENAEVKTKFHTTVEYLDLHLSTGDDKAFKLISTNLKSIRYLACTDELLRQENELITLFENLRKVVGLDFNCCNLFYDSMLALIGCFCMNLHSLTIERCYNISGMNLCSIIQNCPQLKSLKLSGTSLHDDNLANCKWENIQLEELEISWCRNVTETGLLLLLPRLPNLVHLRLCSCGFGQSITDSVLRKLKPSTHMRIKVLDISYSREITNEGIAETIGMLTTLKQVHIASCHKLNTDLLAKISTNKNLLVVASFQEQYSSYFHNNDRYRKSLGGKLSVVPNLERVYDENGNHFSFRRHFGKY